MTVKKIKCPSCGDNDGAGDNLNIKENGFAKCFACGYKVKNIYKMSKDEKPKEKYTSMIEPLQGKYISLRKRCIPKEYCEKWKALYLNDYLGEPALAFTYENKGTLIGYHIKPVSKQCKSQGNLNNAEMYGSWLHNDPEGKLLVITEGHEDCISANIAAGDVMFHYTSLPNGIGSVVKFVKLYYQKLSRYKGIVLCFDNDKAGQEGVRVS